MPQVQTMTLEERFAIADKARELEEAGKKNESTMYMIQHYPMPPYLAKFAKSHMGADFLIKGGFNLAEAEEEFGKDWLAV
ncbi:hypothetical protein TREPR_2805 [Treponema primitia ZAS-2]|uniref:Uncharacterized protein n=1 Tax=Treponema primitia (strain ATCC BAA-887 / DSM 12427 / ZAS-2) TaxID=545694 RepID=F5YPY5_TREPZ|nr:hypothetical protein [Treponema primitia]AEF83997.1 hypothetical protein TREPR_2805 [Treponema primitia ZAS-2]